MFCAVLLGRASGVDRFKRQFAHLEEHSGKGGKSSHIRHHISLPRERVPAPKDEASKENDVENRTSASVSTTLDNPPTVGDGSTTVNESEQNGPNKENYSVWSFLKSESISASKCIGVHRIRETEEDLIAEQDEEVDGLSEKVSTLHS